MRAEIAATPLTVPHLTSSSTPFTAPIIGGRGGYVAGSAGEGGHALDATSGGGSSGYNDGGRSSRVGGCLGAKMEVVWRVVEDEYVRNPPAFQQNCGPKAV